MGRAISSKDIKELRFLLGDTDAKIVAPGDDGYKEAIDRWSKAAVKPAGVAIIPTNVSQISKVVKYASQEHIDLAIHGGGHSTSGSSSTDEGLLIDLRSIRYAIVDPNTKRVRVGGGANWTEVDAELAKYDLATVGGTIGDTGVGGLTLGGGYGWLTGKHGLTIDNLLSVNLVLASGEILKASQEENVDLFWGIRGGGHNFGAVTEFEFQAFDQGPMWAGLLAFKPTPDVIAKLASAINDLFEGPKDGKGQTKLAGRGMGGLVMRRVPEAGWRPALAMAVVYDGSEKDARAAFKPLLDIGPVADTTKEVPYYIANQTLHNQQGARVSMKGAVFSLPISPQFIGEVFGAFTNFTEDNGDLKSSMILFELYDPYVVNTRASNQDTAFANRGWHMNAMIAPYWWHAESDAKGRQWARDMSSPPDMWFAKAGTPQRAGDSGSVLAYGNYDRKLFYSKCLVRSQIRRWYLESADIIRL